MHMKKNIYIYIYIFFKKQQKYFSRKIYLFIFITYVLNAPKINGLYMKKKIPILKFLENLGDPFSASNDITLH